MTRYVYLSTYSSQGFPTNINLDENGFGIKNYIGSDIVHEVDENLPGGVTVLHKHPEWIRNSDLKTKDTCEITISFITEGAGYKNGLGYYVYDITSPPNRFSDIETIYVVFPNASKFGGGGMLSSGDTMKIVYQDLTTQTVKGKEFLTSAEYNFPPGKGIGFVCFANQWKGNGTSWAYLNVNHKMYSTDPALNPEYSKHLKHHSVNYRSKVDSTRIVYGFEDLRRDHYSDDDFNDLVYLVTPTPIDAIDTSSYNSTEKQTYTGHLLCEDVQNNTGDFDYNDLVLKYTITEETENDKIKSINMYFCGKHRGASYNHDFGVVIPRIKSQNKCKIFRETYIVESDTTEKVSLTHRVIGSGTDKIPIIEDTKKFLPGAYTNTKDNQVITTPSYVKLKIIFPEALDRGDINGTIMPYRFYLDTFTKNYSVLDHTIYSDEYYQTSELMQSLEVFSKNRILLLENCDNLRIPIEKVKLHKAYPKFITNLRYNSFQNWTSLNYANENLLKEEIIHDDTHLWDIFLTDDSPCKTINNTHIFLLPVTFDNVTFAFNETNTESILQKNNLSSQNILEWEEIENLNLKESLIEFVKNYGNAYIKSNTSFTKMVGGSTEPMYVSVNVTDKSQTVHSTLNSSGDTLQLLSSNNNLHYIVCKA